MSQTLLISLAATVPLAALSCVAAVAVERSGAGLRLRLNAWRAAFLLPLLVVPAMLTVAAFEVRSPLALAPLVSAHPRAELAPPSDTSPAQVASLAGPSLEAAP